MVPAPGLQAAMHALVGVWMNLDTLCMYGQWQCGVTCHGVPPVGVAEMCY